MRDHMSPEVKQAVVLVGGKGTRLRPLTDTMPKPILPVLDRPCLSYLIGSMAEAGISEVIMACGYRSDQLTEAIGDGSDLGIEITYSYEDEPRGTGGAIKLVEDRLDEVFVAANGDVFADISLKGQIAAHMRTGAAATIALTEVRDPCEYGIVGMDGTGRIDRFKEKPEPEEAFSNMINAGVYVFDRKVIGDIPADVFHDLSKDLFPLLLERGDRMQGYVLDGTWRDVGRPSDLLGANLVMASKRYGDMIWGGKGIVDSDTRSPFYLGAEARLVGSSATGAVIMAGSRVCDSQVTNSLIMRDCTVYGARIENSIVGDGCTVMPGAVVSNRVLGHGTVFGEGDVGGPEVF